MEAEEQNDHGSCSSEDDAANLQPTPLLHMKKQGENDGDDGLRGLWVRRR